MGDRIALLKNGRLMQVGTGQELYSKPSSLFAAGFFSELNVFPARVAGGMAHTPLGLFAAKGFADGTHADVAIRLSGFEVSATDGEIQARVLSRRFLGVIELLELAVSGAERPVRARVRCGALSGLDQEIWLTVRQTDVLVFERSYENA